MSRDLDSLFSEREKAATEEWLRSNKEFHFMRDHPAHSYTILGGCWGCKLTQKVRSQWKGAWKSSEWFETTWFPLMRAEPGKWGPDQLFLEKLDEKSLLGYEAT